MKVTIIGFEGSSGIGAKSGKPCDMGRIFTTARLAPPMAGGVAGGHQGVSIECANSEVVRAIANIPTPFEAEADIQTVVRYGKPEQYCYGITVPGKK